MNSTIRHPLSVATLLAAVLAIPTFASADQTWTGAGADALWTTTDNWSGGAAPGDGDVAVFDLNSTAQLATTLGSDFSILGLRLVDPTGAVSIATGNGLTVGASGIDMSAATQNLTISAPVTLGAAQIWEVAGGRTLVVSGGISGGGGFTKAGAGGLTLANVANTHTGGTTLSAGTVTLGSGTSASAANLGPAGGSVTLAGGTISNGTGGSNGSINLNHNFIVTADSVINMGNRMVIGATGRTLTGSAKLTFNAATSVSRDDISANCNSYAGTLSFAGSGGVRLVINGGSFGGMSAAQVEVNGSATLSPVTNSGGNTIGVGSLSGTSATANLGGGSAGAPTYSVGGLDASTTFAGGIKGNANLTKTGSGTLTLTGADNSHTGVTTVNQGVLKYNGTKTGAGATNVNNGGTLAGTGSLAGTTTVNNGGALSPGDELVDSGIGTLSHVSLTLAGGALLDFEFSTGNDAITVNSGGTLTLNSGVKVNLYDGVAGGPTLAANGTYTLFNVTGVTVVGLTPTTFEVQNPAAGKLYSFASDGTALSVTVDDAVSDPSNFWNTDGAGSWATAGNWTKGTVPDAPEANAKIGPGLGGTGTPFTDATFTIDLDGAQTVGSLILNDAAGVTLAPGLGGSLALDNGALASNIVVTAGTHTLAAPLSIDGEDATIDVADTLTFSISGSVGSSVSGGGFTKSGPGTLQLTGLNTFDGGATLAVGTVAIDNDASLGAAGVPAVFSGGTLRLLANLTDARPFESTGTNNPVIDTNGFNYALAGAITPIGGGTGGLVKNGAGTLTLTAANTYTGNTAVNAGTLELGAGGSIDGAALTFGTAGGTLFHVNGGVFAGTSTTVPAGITGFRLSAGSATFTGALNAQDNSTGAFALINVQGGTLSAASVSVGRSSGSVTAEPAAGATNSGFVVNGAGTIVDIAGNLSVSGSNSTANARMDGGSVSVGGTATIGLNNTGRWSVLDINGGVFTLNNTATGVQLGNGQPGNAIFIVQDGGVADVGKFTFNAAGAAGYEAIVKLNGGTLYLGEGGMARTGTNALCVATVKLQGGTLGASADWISPIDTTLTGTPVIKAADATDAPFNITLSGIVGGTGGLEKTGGGTLTLTAANTYTGNTTVTEGTLALPDDSRLLFVLGATSGSNNQLTGAGTITLDGDFAIDTSAAAALATGTWVLENAASLPGAYGGSFQVVDPDGTPWTDAGGERWTRTTAGGKTWTFDETTGTLTMETGGFDSWIAGFTFSDPLADKSRSGDPDGDGFTNLAEFLFGTAPNAATAALTTHETTGGDLILRWLERTSGATYSLRESATLADPWPASSVTPANDGAPSGDYQPRKAVIPLGPGRDFFLVEGTETP
jgi:autotransporter-associated beta strand protein